MNHKNVIVTKNLAIYEPLTGKVIEEKIIESFTFNIYRDTKDYEALLTYVMFQNIHLMNEIAEGGISLGKSYLVELFKFDINANTNKIKIQLTNEFGKTKFYSLAAFRLLDIETGRTKFWKN
ncbi:hypothetical protein [Emticicia sp. SJ17W-69]|uniref:hypothetical protein n=1 Tax=Emticicia sp. SJ17W-69 TaxID=3421657 RepID=UPI003EBD2E07